MNTDNFSNAADLLPRNLQARVSKGPGDEYTVAASGGREEAALGAASTPDSLSIVRKFDAPPYTLRSLRFGTPTGAQSAVLLCGQARAAVIGLRERLSAPMGTAVDADELDALNALRRDLLVWSERLAELMRSIAKVTPQD